MGDTTSCTRYRRGSEPRGRRLLKAGFAVAVAVGAAALAGCSDSTGPSGPSGYAVEIVFGDAQVGMGGWQLELPIRVRVTQEGTAAAGVSVRFTPAVGGSVSRVVEETDPTGTAEVRWTLAEAAGPQMLTAAARGVSVEILATALDEGEADVIVARGALGPLKGAVLSATDGTYLTSMARLISDTVIHTPPMNAAGRELVLFATANRMALTSPTWTPGRDTVYVDLAPPVAVDIELDVQDGDFEGIVEDMERQLDVMESLWSRDALGAVLGEVTFVDNTSAGPVHVTSSGLCSGELATRIQVAVVTSIDDDEYWGWGCTSGHVFMAGPFMGQTSALYLLAHELGHTFGLGHTVGGVMAPSPPGQFMRAGEAFAANFNAVSTLNRVFDAHPAGLQRFCPSAECLPRGFELVPR